MLVRHAAIGGSFTMMQAKFRFATRHHLARARQRAGRILTNAHDALRGRLVVKHRIKLDDAVNFGQWNAQLAADCFLRFGRHPTIYFLRAVQRRKHHTAAFAGDLLKIRL